MLIVLGGQCIYWKVISWHSNQNPVVNYWGVIKSFYYIKYVN